MTQDHFPPPKACRRSPAPLIVAILALLFALPCSGEEKKGSFRYVGGTLGLRSTCEGALHVRDRSLEFFCQGSPISIPFSSIRFMEYRPKLSEKINKGGYGWVLKPPSTRGKKESYFAVAFTEAETEQVAVFLVKPEVMRPYLAEIDLRSGKRVKMELYERID